MFYLDRVEFRADKVERWFSIAINWQTEKVRERDRDKELPREYERYRIIESIAYKNVACLAEVDLRVYLKELEEEQQRQRVSSELFTKTAAREQRCPHCNRQFQDPIPFDNDPVQVTFMLTLLITIRTSETEQFTIWCNSFENKPCLFVYQQLLV